MIKQQTKNRKAKQKQNKNKRNKNMECTLNLLHVHVTPRNPTEYAPLLHIIKLSEKKPYIIITP